VDKYIKPIILNTIKININLIIIIEHGKVKREVKAGNPTGSPSGNPSGNYHQQLYTMS
jgi:hypothetical protein